MVERATPGAEEWSALHADHLARYLYAMPFAKGRRVLDAGCGPGYGSQLLKAAGASSVQGVDISADAIAGARSRYQVPGVEFLVDDCETLANVRGPLDLICSFENIEHLAHPDRFLRAACDKLGADGVALISTPDRAIQPPYKNGRPANPYHIREWYQDEFLSLVSGYFSDIEFLIQAKSLSLSNRERGVSALRVNLHRLNRNPFHRFSVAVAKLLGRNLPPVDIGGIAAPSVHDFPIVHPVCASLIGQPYCHFVICRQPLTKARM